MTAATLIAGAVLILVAFLFGGAIASFLGVVIERVPRGESINGRSHCSCGRKLRWYENVPVFGWLRVGGVTKCCGTHLPVWYLLFEIGLGLLCAIPVTLFVFFNFMA